MGLEFELKGNMNKHLSVQTGAGQISGFHCQFYLSELKRTWFRLAVLELLLIARQPRIKTMCCIVAKLCGVLHLWANTLQTKVATASLQFRRG